MQGLLIAAALSAGLTGCDRNQPATVSRDKVAGVPNAAVPDANPAAAAATPANEASTGDYTAKAAASDMFEIESSRIAQRRSTNPQVKNFAAMMIDGHAKTTQDLKAALAQSGDTTALPTTLPIELQVKLATLNQVAAEAFDRLYLEAQVDSHQDALNLHARYANVGDIPALKTFATQVAPTIQRHLDLARSLRDSLP